MITSTVGVVLCRLAAIMLFINAAENIAYSATQFFQSTVGIVPSFVAISLTIFAPVVTGVILWIYAERICRINSSSSEAQLSSSLQSVDLIVIGTTLIGLYALLFGVVSAVRIETGFWGQAQLGPSTYFPTDTTVHRVLLRAPYMTQIVLGGLLIVGRRSLTKLLQKVRYVGTGTS